MTAFRFRHSVIAYWWESINWNAVEGYAVIIIVCFVPLLTLCLTIMRCAGGN